MISSKIYDKLGDFDAVKVKKYKKTSRATLNVGYQTKVIFQSASSTALEFLAHNLFIYFAQN